jgi:hypothetical protein
LVVDGGVVPDAYGQEVVEVGASAVAPPSDVVDLAVVEPDGAVGNRARRVDRSERAPLGGVRESGGAAEVQPPGRVHDRAVTDHDGVDVGGLHDVGEHADGELDGDAPVDRGASAAAVASVDHDDHLGTRRPSAASLAQVEQGERLQVGVLVDRV